MTAKWFGLVVPLLVLTFGCGGSEEASPESAAPAETQAASATVKTMLELAESGDWNTYVDRYYGEAHKFGSPDDRRALVTRFEQQWGSAVVDGLREASGITPVIEGSRAVFRDGDRDVFVLYKDDKGEWTFHL